MITLLYRIIPNQPPTHGWRQSAPKPACRPQQPERPPMLAWIREAWRRRRSRVYLSELNEHLLKDIGVTPAEAELEMNKPFWRM